MRRSPFLLIALLPLAACNRQDPPPASTASTTTPRTALGRAVDTGMAKAREELRAGNLDITSGPNIDFSADGKHRVHVGADDVSGKPKAEITPRGELLIDGKAVATTQVQQALLLAYRERVLAIADAGMAVGAKGADLAGEAMGSVVEGLLNGDTSRIEKKMEARGKEIEAEAKKICTLLPPLADAQAKAAAAVPAFAPYATLKGKDIEDCGKGDGVAVTSN